MGSFNATCIVSNLPIEDGTLVRFLALTGSRYYGDGNEHICYVGGRWQLRCPPIRAAYNDYGSIEHLKKRLANRVFFESLSRDCVEKGVGDNQCHDVQVRRGMKTKEWLEALWEGRVYVTDVRPAPRPERTPEEAAWFEALRENEQPPGLPTMMRLEKVLKDAGLSVTTAYGADGYVLDEVSHGFIRIRHGRFEHGEHEAALGAAVPAIHAAGYAAMVTCGTGRYANHAEILVAPLPVPKGAKDSKGREVHLFAQGVGEGDNVPRDKPRPVTQAMIREDVWQIMLKTPLTSWRRTEPYTLADMQKAANAALDQELAWKAEDVAREAERRENVAPDARERDLDDYFRRRTSRDDMENIFRAALHPSEGTSGFALREALELGVELGETREELKGFITDMAETAHVQRVYAMLHGQWHPTTNSGQDGNWKEHRAFLKALSKIKGEWEDEGG